jgi:two-component system sensor histidine kinase KdpD
VKVIAGVVETHGRAETEALLGGLPQQPLVRSEYRGVMLEEMDLDGLLAAKPKLVLVDELAHSNAPGSRHAKRWQDIQELLAAGIDVYTTVNVQHLESLNDQVRGITGVQVRETLPDWVLQEAYELLLIDLPPRELLERLREGKVYVPEQARAAIDAFFTQTNLTALRELAMQTAAAQVDNDLAQGYRQLGQAAPAVRGRLLVGVDGDAQAERLVRHASRVAQRRHLPWSLVHVDNGTVRDEQSPAPASAQQLAERLGGEVVLLRAGEVANPDPACRRTPCQSGAGRPVAAESAPSSVRWWARRAFAAQAHGLEINVLDNDHEHPQPRLRAPTLVWFDYLLALVATVLASAWRGRCRVFAAAEHLAGVPRRRVAGGGAQQSGAGAGLRRAVVSDLRLSVHSAEFFLRHPARRRRADLAVLPADGGAHRQPRCAPAPTVAGAARPRKRPPSCSTCRANSRRPRIVRP